MGFRIKKGIIRNNIAIALLFRKEMKEIYDKV